jgi:hypothetical protein
VSRSRPWDVGKVSEMVGAEAKALPTKGCMTAIPEYAWVSQQ